MTSNQPYWTLTQACAWVIFRDLSVVARFSPPNPQDWAAFMMFPTDRHEFPEVGSFNVLFDALRTGRLQACGRRPVPDATVEEIPAVEWHDLINDPTSPYRRLPSGAKDSPWLDIRIRRADVETFKRQLSETEQRSRYNKVWFQERYAELQSTKGGLPKNQQIIELQVSFQEETRREPPSRSSVQRYIKDM